jgi:tetratricopeptide (TPR) repeat protein
VVDPNDNQGSSGQVVVGREPELASISDFLSGGESAACLVMVGEPGIGKTALWEQGFAQALSSGYRILSSRCSQSEAKLSFASLSDLLDGVDLSAGGEVPVPQQAALEVALGLSAPSGPSLEPLSVAAGFLSVVRNLATQGTVLIAVDDVQWLDSASAECLTFAARRLRGLPVRFLLTRRPSRPSIVERELKLVGVRSMDVGPLSFGAIRHLLADRLPGVLSRRAVHELYESTQGNPLLALELGRSLLETGRVSPLGPLPVPDLAEEVLGARAHQMSAPVRRALLAVALSGGLSRDELSKAVDPLVVEDAINHGYLAADRARLRPTIPMLLEIIRRDSTAAERQQLHLEISAVTADPILRTRHLALAAVRVDEDLAREAVRASEVALERGDIPVSEELAAHALRLTPPDSTIFPDRLMALADRHMLAGNVDSATQLLTSHLDQIPLGRPRAVAYILLGQAGRVQEETAYLDQALALAADDPSLQGLVLARQTIILVLGRVERIDEAERLALAALDLSRRGANQTGAEIDARITHALAWARILLGKPIDEPDLANVVWPSTVGLYETSIDRARGVALAFRGEVAQARSIFQELLKVAEQRGEVRFAIVLNIQLCELELRCGRIGAAGDYIRDIKEWNRLEHRNGERCGLTL